MREKLIWRQIYLRVSIAAIGSQELRLALKRSPLAMHMVPSLPPTQYNSPSSVATPTLLRFEDMLGTGDQRPTRGSKRSTDAWNVVES